jgi:hypothetical protein
MRFEDILTEKRDVSHVSFVKLFVLHKQSLLKLNLSLMEVEELPDMTLT